MPTNSKKTIGIIGGMGPAATIDLFEKIINSTDAETDQEHIHILVDCNSGIPDRTKAILMGGVSPVPMIQDSARRLETAGADFLVIACNTSHYYLEEIQSAVKIPIINMVKESAKYVRRLGFNRAIILGTEGSKKTGLYRRVFESYDVQAIYPDEEHQQQITDIIYKGIKAGNEHWNVDLTNKWLQGLQMENETPIVLACTELPIAVSKYGLKGNFVDPTLVLAEVAVERAGYKVRGVLA